MLNLFQHLSFTLEVRMRAKLVYILAVVLGLIALYLGIFKMTRS